MQNKKVLFKSSLLTALLLTVTLYVNASTQKADSLTFGHLGRVMIYKPAAAATSAVIFISGIEGLNKSMISIINSLTAMNALVIAVDYKKYIKNLEATKSKCVYPAADFEELSQSVQKKLSIKHYMNPVLIGYSSGAALVYATIVQSPARTFAGAISINFTPEIKIKKEICHGNGLQVKPFKKLNGFELLPFPNLVASWTVLQAEKDKDFTVAECQLFTKKITNAHFVLLKDVNHKFVDDKKWYPQFKTAFENTLSDFENRVNKTSVIKKAGAVAALPADMPLTITEAEKYDAEKPLAIIISGDGGWTDFDQSIADGLAQQQIPSAGLSSLKYFWERKNPSQSSADLLKLIQYYSSIWKRNKIVLVGYSYGADVMPFMASRLPLEVQNNIQCVALLSPSATVDFEFHVSSWFNSSEDNSVATKPEIEKLDPKKLLIVYGSDENNDVIKTLNPSAARILKVPGGHHYNDNVEKVTEAIMSYVK
ncbi:MAG: AcvB/VirJ family lysyl-phosphatidylglycerol hydrolase [Bacteroidia bacterium]